MHEQRREQQHRHRVRPVEHPVEAIQAPAEREGEHAEERDGQPEEVQRRLLVGTAQTHRGTDEQGEDADRDQHEVQAGPAVGENFQRELVQLLTAQPEHGVGTRRPVAAGMEDIEKCGPRLDRHSVDREQDVPGRETCADRRGSRCDFGRNEPRRPLDPQHAVLGLGPACPQHVGRRQAQQDGNDTHRQQRAAPTERATPTIDVPPNRRHRILHGPGTARLLQRTFRENTDPRRDPPRSGGQPGSAVTKLLKSRFNRPDGLPSDGAAPRRGQKWTTSPPTNCFGGLTTSSSS